MLAAPLLYNSTSTSNFPPPPLHKRLQTFVTLGARDFPRDDDAIKARGIHNYIIYTAVNHLRHNPVDPQFSTISFLHHLLTTLR